MFERKLKVIFSFPCRVKRDNALSVIRARSRVSKWTRKTEGNRTSDMIHSVVIINYQSIKIFCSRGVVSFSLSGITLRDKQIDRRATRVSTAWNEFDPSCFTLWTLQREFWSNETHIILQLSSIYLFSKFLLKFTVRK